MLVSLCACIQVQYIVHLHLYTCTCVQLIVIVVFRCTCNNIFGSTLLCEKLRYLIPSLISRYTVILVYVQSRVHCLTLCTWYMYI